MKSLSLAVLLIAVAMAQPAAARSYKVGAIEVTDPWTRPAAARMTGVGYLAIRNTGKTPIIFIGATTPLSPKVSLHRTSMAGGVMRMAPVTGGLTVAPGATVRLAPAGYHLMLEGLKQPLALGQTAPLTLRFADGRTLAVDLAVQTAAVGAMAGMEH